MLDNFHPDIQRWFEATYPAPTDVQSRSWPLIADGRHTLITAPTGSGKTLTAFLWSLNRFATGACEPGATRVLYISPLKALNNDIRRNVLNPLAELRRDYGFPDLRVQTRSGDTPQSDRQRMLKRPPDILITTPESLSLLLTTARGRQALGNVETVILDEIHSIVDNRRGVALMTGIERLADFAGEFQRVALSATVRPLDAVAHYVGGYTADGTAREVEIVDSQAEKHIELSIRFPEAARTAAENGQKVWDPLSDSFRDIIDANRSTLFFTNSRRLAEKITHKINRDDVAPTAYSHHGSLSRDVRAEVETRLKAGELKAIVATNSLEMGIDIGDLDEVVLVQSPPSISSTMQRVGRAGHRVGETSRGSLFPTHARDFLEAAVLSGTVAERDIEPLNPMTDALDVLAQIIVSTTASEPWHVDQLFDVLTRSTAYRDLAREQFDLVVEMLAGRYAGSRVRNLKARITYDRVEGTLQAERSAVFAYYNSGGTIPDRGYFKLKHADTGSDIGELDEEFVWEATLGQVLTLGTQNWQIMRITHNDVIVRPARSASMAPPFWRAEAVNRSYHFSERIGEFLETAEADLARGDADGFRARLAERGFDESAATELTEYLSRQRAHTAGPLPHRRHLLIELVYTGPAGYRGPDGERMMVLHTFWGGRVNRPIALALKTAWRERFESVPEIFADNDAIVVQLKQDLAAEALLDMISADRLEPALRESLEGSGFFGARFRECAGRSLLLTRQKFNQRLPLWMSRLQAKKLMTAVRGYADFPVLLETWRTCLKDEFDLPNASRLLDELANGVISWSFATASTPSPFASNITFNQVNRYMYADDTPEKDEASSLSGDLIERALGNAALRPRIRPAIVEEFEAKRQRRAPGYEPIDADAWSEWIKERILLPEDEWPEPDVAPPHVNIVAVDGRRWLAHREQLPGLIRPDGDIEPLLTPTAIGEAVVPDLDDPRDALSIATEILSFHGPVSATRAAELLPRVPEGLLENADNEPQGEGPLISGALIDGDETHYYCDTENFDILMRFQRAADRPQLGPLPIRSLPGFLASWQRFGTDAGDDGAIDVLEKLRGYPIPLAALDDLMAARLPGYDPTLLDRWFTDFELTWWGIDRQIVGIGYPEDLTLLATPPEAAPATLFRDPAARYTYNQLLDGARDMSARAFNEAWWQHVWDSAITADSLAPLRSGLTRGFELDGDAPARTGRGSRQSRRRAWSQAAGWPGLWRLTPLSAGRTDNDPLTALEDAKERARLLLHRYGFVCRELANREAGAGSNTVRWRLLFKACALMELAGEVFAGYFFTGLSGPQFISPRALNALQRGVEAPAFFWCSAMDPVAPTGMGLTFDDIDLPNRRPQNLLAFLHGELALVVENHGRRLQFRIPPDHTDIDLVLTPLIALAETRKRVPVDTINGEPARTSTYLDVLSRHLKRVHDHKQVYYERSL